MEQERNIKWYARELGLLHIISEGENILRMAGERRWSIEETLTALFQGEYERRLVGRQKARIKTAGFSQMKYLEELDRNELPETVRELLPRLETLDFIKEHRNIVLYGNPGTGKTHIAIGLALYQLLCLNCYNLIFYFLLLTSYFLPLLYAGRCRRPRDSIR